MNSQNTHKIFVQCLDVCAMFRDVFVPQCGEIHCKLIYMFGFILWSSLQYFITLVRLVTSSRHFPLAECILFNLN